MRTALVTGGSRGIGAAIAAHLRAEGCQVFSPPHSELDLASNASIDGYLAAINQPIDILVNNAGINRIAALEEMSLSDIQVTLQVNLLAALRLTQALVPAMRRNRFGRIVNISSIWSLVSRPGRTTYAMSKSALNAMTRSLAVELAPDNVLVNAVAPGYVMTDLTLQNNSPAEIKKISQMIPIRRMADPAEIATVVAFLCSAQNSYLAGQVLVVDGGYTCL
jgi:3-oxoacyl-[acyl-carrier protein] reductase